MVLIVGYSGAFGGAERPLLPFALALGSDLCLACPEGPLAAAARAHGLSVMTLPLRSLALRGGAPTVGVAVAALVDYGVRARRLARDLDADVVVAWSMRSALACLLGPRMSVPVVFHHHDLLAGAMIARLVRAAARRAVLTISLSRSIEHDLDPSGALASKSLVISPGVDVERFDDGGPPTAPTVLVLGALTEWKRADLALEACALARRRLPGLTVRVVGAPLGAADRAFVRAANPGRGRRSRRGGEVRWAGRRCPR